VLEAAVVIKPNFRLRASGVWIGISRVEDPWETEFELATHATIARVHDGRAAGVAAKTAQNEMNGQHLRHEALLDSPGARRATHLRIALVVFCAAALASLLAGAMFSMFNVEAENDESVRTVPTAPPKMDTQRSPEA
jgi:hypothetical protein